MAAAVVDVGTRLKCNGVRAFPAHLEMTYTLDDTHPFITRVFYPPGVLGRVTEKIGAASARSLWCHIALFEGLKFMGSLPLFPSILAARILAPLAHG